MIKRLTALLVCITFAMYLSSCGTVSKSNIIESVVEIKAEKPNSISYGTGFFISESQIMTCRHIIRYYDFQIGEYSLYDTISIRTYDSDEFIEVKVDKVSNEQDLAILFVEGIKPKHILKMEDRSVSVGEDIYTIGNPNGIGLSYFAGAISSPKRLVAMEDGTIETLQLNIEVSDGNSGGPVVDDKNKVIGIISFRLRGMDGQILNGLAYAIPVKTMIEFTNN